MYSGRKRQAEGWVSQGGAITIRNPLYQPTSKAMVMYQKPVAPKKFYQRNYRRGESDEELKFFDTAVDFNFDATGEVPATGQLALIPQGDTEATRDGRKAVVKSIGFKGDIIYTPGASTVGSVHVTLYIVQDMQCNGAAAAVTDVMTNATLFKNYLNLSNSGRFKILKKWNEVLTCPAGTSAAYNTQTRYIEWFQKCSIPLEFSGATGAITELKSNNIFLMAGTNGTEDDVAVFTGKCRLRFVG